MNILVFNVGSTTLKYACVDVVTGKRETFGLIDRIGQPGGDAIDHLSAARLALERHAAIRIDAIGHRVVQGGDLFSLPTLVTRSTLDLLATLDTLAPLHNPPARQVLEASFAAQHSIPQVMVFDSAYFATLPPKAYRYAIPDEIYQTYKVRRYGAHGTSHQYVTQQAIDFVRSHPHPARMQATPCEPSPERVISLHLGGGASATASIGGVAVETSMGMTPLEGLVMATRTGDIDPSVVLHLMRARASTVDEIDRLLNKQSGLLGLCGEVDMRAVLARREAGDEAATLAIDLYVHRIKKYIGSYVAVLGGLDVLVFTAGVGENSAVIRELIAASLGCFGIAIDGERNAAARAASGIVDISDPVARVRTLVVPTNEELAIAGQVAKVVKPAAVS